MSTKCIKLRRETTKDILELVIISVQMSFFMFSMHAKQTGMDLSMRLYIRNKPLILHVSCVYLAVLPLLAGGRYQYQRTF